MVDQDDVHRIGLALPDTFLSDDGSSLRVRHGSGDKPLAWVWLERTGPKGPREPRPDVLAVRVGSQEEKDELIAADPDTYFTEHHYDGYPAVLVRLDAVDQDELRERLTDAWRSQAPRALVKRSGL
ncbi:MmcQ/YjbR family DNA-binding protein [Streptomyces sp. NBC_01476]|uniref:MmcQ/YjbR family DNA-binding protein n=1 Tax=Streptomyces sp. NBC_01476 TaxID=2903881 RepID=UPI002E373262|nr:MmcQ/YjbR family DNA-binding protein [Streptomyces sp. NBC_01476]